MPDPIVMLAVGEKYRPAAGMNTFRKLSDKYYRLWPGTLVEMHHKATVDSMPYAVELLEVESVARGTLRLLLANHADDNHEFRSDFTAEDRGIALLGVLERAYGPLSLDDMFAAVSFR